MQKSSSPPKSGGAGSAPITPVSRKRKIEHRDVAASSYNSKVFTSCCPFVLPSVLKEGDDYDVFSGGFCDPRTIRHLLEHHIQPIVDDTALAFLYGESGELPWRIVLGTMFTAFRKLALGEHEDADEIFAGIGELTGIGELSGDLHSESDKDEAGLDMGKMSSEGSARSLLFRHEDSTALPPRQSLDFGAYVQDKKVTSDPLQTEYRSVAAVMEGKGPSLSTNSWWTPGPLPNVVCNGSVWQTARYAAHHALVNLGMGRKKPIYILNLAPGSWAAAVLVPLGLVGVDDCGKLVEDDVLDEWGPLFSTTNLDKRLQLARELKKEDGCNQIELPSKAHLVARLYIKREVEPWQNFPTSRKGGIPLATHHLMEALLRILVGKRVQNWTPKHLDAIRKKHEDDTTQQRMRAWKYEDAVASLS